MGLDGKVAVVTGGASGIGRSICLRLARDGADVAIWDLNLEGAGAVAEEVESAGAARRCGAGRRVGRGERSRRGGPDPRRARCRSQILVNDAGIAGYAPLLEMTEEQWDRMIAVHLRGTFLCTKALVPDMIAASWGRVVNISSLGALIGGPGLAHYAAAKAGMIGFTRALTHELGPRGITINAIAPSVTDTPMLRGSGVPEEILRQSVQGQPIRRMGTPEDIAAACAYLVSEEAGFFTGQVMSPNGGRHL